MEPKANEARWPDPIQEKWLKKLWFVCLFAVVAGAVAGAVVAGMMPSLACVFLPWNGLWRAVAGAGAGAGSSLAIVSTVFPSAGQLQDNTSNIKDLDIQTP